MVSLNFLFILLVGGTTYVFLTRKMKHEKKRLLIYIKFILFSIFLLLRNISLEKEEKVNESRFLKIPQKNDKLDFIFENPNFKFRVKNNSKKTISLKTDLEKKKGLKIYFNENLDELKFLINNLVKKSDREIINLKYLKKEENWQQNQADILQEIKTEILAIKNEKEKIFIFENLSLDLLQNNFLDLIILFSNYFENSRFFILENNQENFKFIRRRYKYLNVFEIDELDPEVFKSCLIYLLVNSPRANQNEVQAARLAHDFYKDNGASIGHIIKIYEKYYY